MKTPLRLSAVFAAIFCIAVAARAVNAEDFARPPSFSQMKLSPDGKFVAYTVENEDLERVFFMDLSNGQARGVDVPTPYTNYFGKISGIAWVSDQRLLIGSYSGYVAIDRSGKDYAYLTGYARTYRMNRRDNERIQAGQIIFTDPAGDNDSVLMEEYDPQDWSRTGWIGLNKPNIIRMNTRTSGFKRYLDNPGDIAGWMADMQGRVRLAFQFKGRKRTVLYRSSEKDAWRELPGLGDGESKASPLGFNAKGDRLYVSLLMPNDHYALYSYDPETDQPDVMLLSHDHYDITPSLIRDRRGNLLGVRFATTTQREYWFDPELAALQAKLNRAMPDAVNLMSSFSRDLTKVLVLSYSDKNPGTYYLLDRTKGALTKLVDREPWLPTAEMAGTSPIKLTSRDGLELHGYLTVPAGRQPQHLPLMVMPHGGPWLRDVWGFDPLEQYLAHLGYAVLKVNYRGSTGYGWEYYKSGFRQVGTGMQNDIADAAKWAIERGIADPKRVGIIGGSFGGYSAYMGLILYPELYHCAISIAGVSDWAGVIKQSAELHPKSLPFNAGRIGNPNTESDMLRSISPAYLADKINAPLFIIHGRDDPVVPYDQAKLMMHALDEAGKPYESMSKFNEPHGINNFKNRTEMYERIGQFLKQHLPAD